MIMGGDKLREEMDKVRLFFFYNVDRFNREIMQSVKIANTLEISILINL